MGCSTFQDEDFFRMRTVVGRSGLGDDAVEPLFTLHSSPIPLIFLHPHPEEPQSGVSKEDPVITGYASSFETDLKILLRMRLRVLHFQDDGTL